MDSLTLEAPAPIAAIPVAEAAGLVPIDEGTRVELEDKVDRYIAELTSLSAHSPDFGVKADQLANLGQREISALANQSNRFLERSTRSLKEGEVSANLARLREVVEALDPGRRGNLLEPRRILGIIPAGSKLKAYFDQYAPAQQTIEAILRGLSHGRDELMQDNIALDGERRKIWEQMGKLEQMIHICRSLDAKLEDAALSLDHTDPAKARAVRDMALFQTRQRSADLLTQMAVAVQGYLALDLIRKSNIELIKGVDRASTTTVAALRTAITVAQALAGQRLVLDQIAAVNASASNMIEGSSRLLRNDSVRIAEQASSSAVDVEALQRAFANIYSTMDAVDNFKAEALGSMKQTVEALSSESDKARRYIDRAGAGGMQHSDGLSLG
ncbi:toxic anion resistance protein [Sphingomonas sp.]|uniref:toxic anion resistance protein n=1 Tax=Sphingomonas sp. TaxID=28214 RepID=UPI003D6D7238